jgi:cellulose synthase/poly-beta-1,6-N-acetylglucosamine synthase-like glycosyltransferase
MNNIINVVGIILQVLAGYNLVLPFVFLLLWLLKRKHARTEVETTEESDFAIIVTAYQHVSMLGSVVDSILKLRYTNYHIYIVADNCGESELTFDSKKVTVLRPNTVLASNTRSHQYAIDHFIRKHNYITIIDSDNLVHEDFLKHLNLNFRKGVSAIQGVRAAKNLNTSIACLDAARDLYYHFYDGKVLFEIGSSATLSGSGMAFSSNVYKRFLGTVQVSGAGFDKVLQAWLVMNNYQIAFNSDAIVYDEKTSKTDQLVQQRSRWINSWFKYASLGLKVISQGIRQGNKNQFLFGVVLLRPPLFIFLALSMLSLVLNLSFGNYFSAFVWMLSFVIFIVCFIVALKISKADKRILNSLVKIPTFVYYQFVSLLNAKRANKISVSTKH